MNNELREECCQLGKAYSDGYKQGRADAIDELVKKFEEIDICEYAMFSLCLVKEIAEQLKEQAHDC